MVWRRPAVITLPAPLADAGEDLEYCASAQALLPGNRVTLLRAGGETYPAMLEAIASAEEYVHLEVYILHSDATGRRIGDALAERAAAGVTVRLLVDGVGSIDTDPDWIDDLKRAGVRFLLFHPPSPGRPRWGFNRRDHRKILVVDGRVGFTGGLNIGDEYAPADQGGGGWHDMHARVEGPAVTELARLFRSTWIREGGDRFPFPEPPAAESVATPGTALALAAGNRGLRRRGRVRRAYLHAIDRARRTVSIMNAYFIPDRGIRRALARAARRGASVRVLVPGRSDLRAVRYASQRKYEWLLRHGVRILEWPGRMMHAKTAVVDSVWSTVGSHNLDARSLFHNLEVVLSVVDRPFGARMQRQFDEDAARCREVTLVEWRRRPWWRRLAEWFFYRFRHWL